MPNWRKVITSGSDAYLNSLNVTSGVTGSLFGTSSWAENAISSSFSQTASYLNTLNQDVTINGGLTVNGTGSFDYLIVKVIESASVIYSTGSNQLGDSETDTQLLYGDVRIPTGSLIVTGSVFLTSSHIAYPDYIDFNTTGPEVQPSVGRLSWNQTDLTLDLGTGDGDTTLQSGQETVYPLVFNADTINLVEGTLVMIDPNDIAQGDKIRVVRSITDGTYPSQYLVGILTEDIAQGADGFVTWFGKVRNLNISTLESAGVKPVGEAWAEGDVLYPNPAVDGGLTFTPPPAPNLNGTIAVITSINGPNLTMLVRPTLTFTFTELTNVATSGSTDGDLIIKSGSLWVSTKQLSGSYGITGSLNVDGGITGSLFGTSSWAQNSVTASYYGGSITSASYAETASYVNGIKTKANVITAGTFTGNPKKATVTFSTAFPNTNYSIVVTGEDSRTWTIESKLAGSFVVNSNSNVAPAGNTYWQATSYGEFNG